MTGREALNPNGGREKLVIAIPSKGRLQENTNAYFAAAGMPVTKTGGTRGYRGEVTNLPNVEILFLSSGEIIRELAAGNAHLGVTGADLLRENLGDAAGITEPILPLGFGHADLVVAVPAAWIDVRNLHDLDDVLARFSQRYGSRMRVATKYVNLTHRFFSSHHIYDYRIVQSVGATEGAPLAGSAELIVDITTTGATLAANGLRILPDGVILKSQANLMASLKASWSSSQLRLVSNILAQITARENARSTAELRFVLATTAEGEIDAIAERWQCTSPFATVGDGEQHVWHCPRHHVYAVTAALHQIGVETVVSTDPGNIFRKANPLYRKLCDLLDIDPA